MASPKLARRLSVGLLCLPLFVGAQVDYSQYVNVLIGSEGPYPGLAFGGGDIFVSHINGSDKTLTNTADSQLGRRRCTIRRGEGRD